MNEAVTQRPRARLDLLEQFVYLGEEVGAELAESYLAEVDKTCLQLLRHPRIGVAYDCGIKKLRGLRRFPVTDFKTYLIFYLQVETGIDIIRILHGARDIASLFAKEET